MYKNNEQFHQLVVCMGLFRGTKRQGAHLNCDRLYFEFTEEMYGNVENPRIIVLDCDKYSHLTSK